MFLQGARSSTTLLYLNEVEVRNEACGLFVQDGGATVFPFLGVKVNPVKNSAVFWYNLLPTHVGDRLTLHAGCPIKKGEKWVATKWFHEFPQPNSQLRYSWQMLKEQTQRNSRRKQLTQPHNIGSTKFASC
eukprot:Platyproteum_vivax@DN7002_c0_g1_i1.p2